MEQSFSQRSKVSFNGLGSLEGTAPFAINSFIYRRNRQVGSRFVFSLFLDIISPLLWVIPPACVAVIVLLRYDIFALWV